MATECTEKLPAVSIVEVCAACRDGDMQSLRIWKDSGLLPDLMHSDTADHLPHELAAVTGQLDMLKWLVSGSGQQIDLTHDQQTALQLAAFHGSIDVVKWLLVESGQPVQASASTVHWALSERNFEVIQWLVQHCTTPPLLANDDGYSLQMSVSKGYFEITDWLLREGGQLEYLVGVNSEDCAPWTQYFPEEIQRLVARARVIDHFLTVDHVPPARRRAYLQSELCYQAILSGVVRSISELDRFLTESSRRRPSRKL